MPDPVAVILLAYGSVESLDDLDEFLLDIRGGRPLPPPAVAEIKSRYSRIGGRSPLNEITRAQARALEAALGGEEAGYRCFVGMRHWHPKIAETARAVHEAGMRRWVGLPMAPQTSRLSTGAYRAKLEEAVEGLEPAPEILWPRSWNAEPLFLEAIAARVAEALERFPADRRDGVHILLTAHSLPERIREWNDPYPGEFEETARGVMALVGDRPWRIAYQSQAMSRDAWLGPDVPTTLAFLQGEGVTDVLLVPVGFVADHVEVLYDIDIDFQREASGRGLRLERTASLNDDPTFLRALAGVVRRTVEGTGG